MSTVKISELTALTSADAADELVIVDDSAGVTKKITHANLANFGTLVTASAGITFGADTLDDYEEGTWTPVYFADSGFSASSISSSECYYTKIGNTVHLYGLLVTNGTDPGLAVGNQIAFSGFPFAAEQLAANAVSLVGTALVYSSFNSNIWAQGFFTYSHNDNGGFIELTVVSGSIAANNSIMFSGTYQID